MIFLLISSQESEQREQRQETSLLQGRATFLDGRLENSTGPLIYWRPPRVLLLMAETALLGLLFWCNFPVMRWHETQTEIRKWFFFLTKKRSNDLSLCRCFCGVLNGFNPDTDGSFYRVAMIVVNKEKNARGEKKTTKQLSNSLEFLLPTCSLKAKKTGGNKVDIRCSVWMTESKMLTLQLLLSWIFNVYVLLYCQQSEKRSELIFLQYSDIIPSLQKGKEKKQNNVISIFDHTAKNLKE